MMQNYTTATDREKSDFHYEIWKARRERGLPVFGTVTVENHPLYGVRFLDEEDSFPGQEPKYLTIERIYLQWHWGYYWLTILYHTDSMSHGTRSIAKWNNQIYNIEALKERARAVTSVKSVGY